MLKTIIEQEYGCITDNEMHFALDGLTLEIKIRRLHKGEKTALPYVMDKITSYVDYYRREVAVNTNIMHFGAYSLLNPDN